MRVLILPYIYQNRKASSCSTVVEALNWAKHWIDVDGSVHVTWLMPPKEHTHWTDEFMMADHEQVTVLESRFFMQGESFRILEGWREGQMLTLAEEVEENGAYWDVVINQQPFSNFVMYSFIHELYSPDYSKGRPTMWVKHVHDFYAPDVEKNNWRYPHGSWGKEELTSLMYSDRTWGDSPTDIEMLIDYARSVYKPTHVKWLQDRMEVLGCIMDMGDFDREYSDGPEYVHVAGVKNADKRWDIVFEIAEKLYERFGIKTIRTSMGGIGSDFQDAEWAECHSDADHEQYHADLKRGDICIVASAHEGGGLTFFEQGGSGQVNVFLDHGTRWVHDQTPDDYPFMSDSKSGLLKQAFWVVKNWDEACDIHSEFMDYVEDEWGREAVGGAAYESLVELHDERMDSYSSTGWDEEVIEQAMDYLPDGPQDIWSINKATRQFTKKGDPLLDLFTYTYTDMILCLKQLGYEDVGGRVPTFE